MIFGVLLLLHDKNAVNKAEISQFLVTSPGLT